MPSAGQLWSRYWAVGKEALAGQAVAATRKMYYTTDSRLTRTRAARPKQVAVGTRDNIRGFTLGPTEGAGQLKQDVSPAENIELFLAAIQGGVSPTSPGATAKLWTFKPSTSLDSQSYEWDDGANVWQGRGMRVNQLTLEGNATGTNMLTADLFGTDVVAMPGGVVTPGLTDRTYTYEEGYEARLYCDPFGNAPGTTVVPGTLINWRVQVQNNLGRKYTADNTLAANKIPFGLIGVTAQLTIEASTAFATAEFANWDAATKRALRLEFGQNALIDAGTSEVQSVAISGTPTGGTFTLSSTYGGITYTTAPMAYNATAAAVSAALQNLPNIGAGNVLCAGGPLPGSPVTVTYQGALANRDVPTLGHVDSLTGGSSPAVAVTVTTPGVNGMFQFETWDLPGAWSAYDLTQTDAETTVYRLDFQGVYDPTSLAAMLQVRAQNTRATAY